MRIPKNQNILAYLQKTQTPIIAPCNGQGTCGKCKVLMHDQPNPLPLEKEKLSPKELASGVRLACLRTVDKETEITVLLETNPMHQSHLFSTPDVHDPYIKLVKEDHHYSVYRDEKIIKETSEHKAYGIGIDLGTTTLAFALIDLVNKEVVDDTSCINPQTAFGSDVISRIDYAKDKDSLKQLSTIIREKLDQQIKYLLSKNDIEFSDLYEVVIAANTTMVYLLMNKDPSSIAKAPYHAEMLDQITTEYRDLFDESFDATVTIFGGLDAYVGGDITSGILSQDLDRKKDYNILLDLGTNGEIVLLNQDHIYATSTALGPAFEGVNISSGMGAVSGAIDQFTYPNDYHTINNKEAVGLCGSGLIDVVYELHNHKIINHRGRLKESFHITEEIKITQQDIREIQLAKAAVKAGIEHLLINAKIDPSHVKHLYISGGFGLYTNTNHLIEIGMIPSAFQDKTIILGNSSLSGTVKYLLSPLKKTSSFKQTLSIISLTTPLFQDLFVDNMDFPNKK
jgi:uncharacterized 2Fe-2S/4Fe-4S cluster protein (DUF4445 family)